jgi:hypothetical protein
MTFDDMRTLAEAIQAWRPGDPVPEWLVAFPHHTPDHDCGLCASGHFLEDYIHDIQAPELLDALVLDPRTDEVALAAALRRMLRTRGLARTADFLSAASARQPDLARRPAFAAVGSGLRSRCVLIKIARFSKDRPVPLARAREVIRAMQSELLSGIAWKSALNRAQDALRDETKHRPGQPFWGPTHLSYAFDGRATPEYRDLIDGQDLGTDRYAAVPAGHLEVVFEARGGTHLVETGAAIWLYHVEEYFEGTALGQSPRSEPTAEPGAAPDRGGV